MGSSPESDLRLDSDLVSRQHALLTVSDDGVVAEDRGSTNGMFIDGHRLRRGVVAVGSVLRIGPFELVLERRDPEDDEVAIRLSEPPTASRIPAAPREASTVVDGAGPDPNLPMPALDLLEQLISWRLGDRGDDVEVYLRMLRESLHLVGVANVSWPLDAPPVCHAAAGVVGSIPAVDELTESVASPSGPPAPRGSSVGGPGRSEVLPIAVSATADGNRQCTLLWTSSETPGWLRAAGFQRCLGRLVPPGGPGPVSRPSASRFGRELPFPEGFVIGTAPRMIAVYDQIRSIGESDLPIVLTGESGVGKEGVARLCHASSRRREAPFVAVNCAAIPTELMEAEMFGVAKGAATGVRARPGWFRDADGGTLFLDEIGEMSVELQSKLLRVLQEREVHPVGGAPTSVDVRLLSATNVDLEDALGEGRLRSDLYYRLAGVVLGIPPLRHRREDLPEFVAHFLRVFAEERGVRVAGVTVRALRLLSAYPWPGNVRQLEYEMRRIVYSLADGELVDSNSLSEGIRKHEVQPQPSDEGSLALGPRLAAVEGRLIREALRRSGGLRNRAAELLEISRNGLAKKMKRLRITFERGDSGGTS